MQDFDIPMVWDLYTVERIRAETVFEAERVAFQMALGATGPKSDPSTWRIEGRFDAVNVQEMKERYPSPKPFDPMEDWTCDKKPGAYEGGYWRKTVGPFELHVIGDDGPIDVGMSFTTYRWMIVPDSLDFNVSSKRSYNDKEECRDECLEMLENLKSI